MNRPYDTTGNHEPIPGRMARLPRYGHLAVPWVVRWTMTAPEADQVQFVPELGDVASCDCIPGEGRPEFANMCYPRLRQAMTERRCGQCGQKLGDRMYWAADNDSQTWNEPANHAECLAYALRACPDLKRTVRQQPDFGVVEAPGYWLHTERSPHRAETGTWHHFPPGTPVIVQQLIGGILFAYLAEPRAKTRHNAVAWLRQRDGVNK